MNYEKDGIEVIPGVFTREEAEEMKQAALSVLSKQNVAYKHKFIEYTPNGSPAIAFFPCFVSSVLGKYRTDKRLVNIVKKYLGNDVKQLNNQIYYRQPGDEDEFGWHQDVLFRVPTSEHRNISTGYLQTIIALDDIDEENGAVDFIPGSHKWGKKDEFLTLSRKFERRGLEGIKYKMKAGDVAIWHCLTVHGSEKNSSSRSRMTYMNGFSKTECADNWPVYLNSGKLIPIDPTKIP